MPDCFFVSDLHGKTGRYESLFPIVEEESPDAIFIGGDILPHGASKDGYGDFLTGYILPAFEKLRSCMGASYPEIFLILGNDDGRHAEAGLIEADREGLISYMHGRKKDFAERTVYGYSYTPPSPFMLKDWERYDVSRYVDPGCTSPEEGRYTVDLSADEKRYATIAEDLEVLADGDDLEDSVFLFHGPPYRTSLDRAALDGRIIESIPMDVNVGSIAMRRFIEARQPLMTLHGHIHESARLTGKWLDRIGRTVMISAAHDGKELALVRFDLDDPEGASRELV